MVLANGHIAKLTFEKGPSGQRALDDAIASWQAQFSPPEKEDFLGHKNKP
jgi:hypothetical protein